MISPVPYYHASEAGRASGAGNVGGAGGGGVGARTSTVSRPCASTACEASRNLHFRVYAQHRPASKALRHSQNTAAAKGITFASAHMPGINLLAAPGATATTPRHRIWNPSAQTVREDRPRGPSAWTVRADRPRGQSARTVCADRPRGRSARTVRADRPRGPSERTFRADILRGSSARTLRADRSLLQL